MELQIPMVSIDDLRQFHATHFPHACIPGEVLQSFGSSASQEGLHEGGYEAGVEDVLCEDEYEEDGLGYYPDGVKRTLTDADIAFLRHSEIQTIIRGRRQQRDADDNYPSVAAKTTLSPSDTPGAIDPSSSESTTQPRDPIISTETADKIQGGRVEKSQTQQWTKTSAKTKARNAKNRKKNRLNHRARKKEEQKKKDQKWRDEQVEDDEESDEWSPRHQANGPDVQKDDTVDLDY